jgi:glycerophosphoryl diester phosphodiesterase
LSVFELSSAKLAAIPLGEPARFGARFADARAPTLAAFAAWLAAHPKITAFVEFKVESIERFGRATVLDACTRAMAPAKGYWAPISFDYEILALAGDAGFEDLGWVVRGFDAEVAAHARNLPARWLFCNHLRLPPGPLPRGPWDWVIYEVADAPMAQALMARGARWLETMAAASLRQGLEAAMSAPGAPDAPTIDRGSAPS